MSLRQDQKLLRAARGFEPPFRPYLGRVLPVDDRSKLGNRATVKCRILAVKQASLLDERFVAGVGFEPHAHGL